MRRKNMLSGIVGGLLAFCLVFSMACGAEAWGWPSARSVETAAGGSSVGLTTLHVSKAKGASTLMSTLKKLGWKGIRSGVGAVAVANGIAGAEVVNNTLLADDEALGKAERSARAAGRVGSYAGGIAAGAGAYLAVGGSAASASGTLAAIGGVVGGGMTAGATILVGAPAAVAAAAGLATYGGVKLVQWLLD